MIHPESKFKQIWNGIILLFTIYFAIEVPARIALGYHLQGVMLVVDLCVTACLLADVVLNFFTGEYIKGQLSMDRKAVAWNYLKGWFWIDFLAAIPLDLILVGPLATLTDTARIIRLLRFARMARIAQFMRQLAQADIINISVLRMIFLTFWVVMVAHWAACVWIVLGSGNLFDNEAGINPDNKIPDMFRHYVRSLYWATTTITTIGYGDLTPKDTKQTLYTMLMQLLGAGLYGYVIGNIASLIANMDVARAQYLEKIERIGTFMKFKKIPPEMQQEIRNYYSYLWDTRRGYDEKAVLAELPRPLIEKVSLYLLQQMIEKVPIFQGASPDLIRQIVVSLKPEVYTPGDYVFRRGDLGHTMYFIARGQVQVVSDDGATVYATLKEGNFFGEIALLMSMPRTASVRATDFTDLYSLDKDVFAGIVAHYPVFSDHIVALAEQRAREIGKRTDTASPQDKRSASRPPRVEALQAVSENGSVRLSWKAAERAVVYQVIRKTGGRWKILNGFVESTSLVDDLPEGDGLYRVRAANERGTGDWSDTADAGALRVT